MKRVLAAAPIAVVLAAAAVVADAVPEDVYYRLGLRPLFDEAARAAENGDHAAADAALTKALRLAPHDATTLWESAQASARAGDRVRAVDLLERLAAQNPGWSPTPLFGFGALQADERFRAVAARLARPVRRPHPAAVAFTMEERDLIPEGLAYDPRTRTLFLGSIHQRKVIAIGADGRGREFTRPGQDGLLQALGMKVDRGLLWVASYASSGRDEGAAAVHAFDLRSGRTVESYSLPPGGRKHLLNDLVLVGRDVYVTESLGGALYRLDRRTRRLEEFLPAGTFIYPNGIAASRDGRRLFVASWGPGVSLVEIATRRLSQLASVPGAAPIGIDGLYCHDRALIAVQNGVEPNRVTRFFLDERETYVEEAEVLEADHPAFEIPTTGAIAGEGFYLIANSQLRREKDGRIVTPTDPVRILRIELP